MQKPIQSAEEENSDENDFGKPALSWEDINIARHTAAARLIGNRFFRVLGWQVLWFLSRPILCRFREV
jgi:hypothetical protein